MPSSAIRTENTIGFYKFSDCRYKSRVSEIKKDGCIIIGNTVTSVCTMPAAGVAGAARECTYMSPFMGITPVLATHRTISGTVSTTNIIMANWTTQMWQSVMNRVARLAGNWAIWLKLHWRFCHSRKLKNVINKAQKSGMQAVCGKIYTPFTASNIPLVFLMV
ncbi:hypothetical protein KIN20_029004 [Parelaphostrongylus tenuis]|uniref:Uncharacterized protein n=1 Tax=Parelaphostrongylus tenuis TaxID=148309 RepID=A0AAD5R1U7_PARTN|nr:hypothetical protein KIN20_029004 [Parelaphostrongylus tenuis]